MSLPWEDFAPATAVADKPPWEDFAPPAAVEETPPWADFAPAPTAATQPVTVAPPVTPPDKSYLGLVKEDFAARGLIFHKTQAQLAGDAAQTKAEVAASATGPMRPVNEPTLGPAIQETMADLSTPRGPLPKMEAEPGDSIIEGAGKGIYNTAVGLPEFFTSPLGAATAGLGPLAGKIGGRLISSMFARQMAAGAGEAAGDISARWGEMTPGERAQALTETGISAVMAVGLAKHTAFPKEAVAAVPDADKIAARVAKESSAVPPEVSAAKQDAASAKETAKVVSTPEAKTVQENIAKASTAKVEELTKPPEPPAPEPAVEQPPAAPEQPAPLLGTPADTRTAAIREQANKEVAQTLDLKEGDTITGVDGVHGNMSTGTDKTYRVDSINPDGTVNLTALESGRQMPDATLFGYDARQNVSRSGPRSNRPRPLPPRRSHLAQPQSSCPLKTSGASRSSAARSPRTSLADAWPRSR